MLNNDLRWIASLHVQIAPNSRRSSVGYHPLEDRLPKCIRCEESSSAAGQVFDNRKLQIKRKYGFHTMDCRQISGPFERLSRLLASDFVVYCEIHSETQLKLPALWTALSMTWIVLLGSWNLIFKNENFKFFLLASLTASRWQKSDFYHQGFLYKNIL